MRWAVLCRFWDPTCGKFARTEDPAHDGSLSEAEADSMLAELEPCVDAAYRGQGQALHSARKAPA